MSQLTPSSEKTYTITYRAEERNQQVPETVRAAYFVTDPGERLILFKDHRHAVVLAVAIDAVLAIGTA